MQVAVSALKTALLLGGSGQIGQALLPRLLGDGWQVMAVSRRAAQMPPMPGVQWLNGSLQQMPRLPHPPEVIFSCGPLDAFSLWYAQNISLPARVIAFGSTSLKVKQDSIDVAEREMVARLGQAEGRLIEACTRQGGALTLLRPTLVYGADMDKSLTRIAALAARFGHFVLPRTARGLRQPVHVDDLADAALACLHRNGTIGRSYDLPGGETLNYIDMVRRVLANIDPAPCLHLVPLPVFSALLWLARASGKVNGFNDAMLARMQQDLVFDSQPAREDFGYAPRAFQP
ncbi:nucleoside-diphosphate sugar epimerase [Lysobacteraceae bacterium NML71-0210]|nr:nucleoside-diphosphate sugar epimerase [Xanthomonadaceae bacterium NML71-0210]